MDSHLDSSLHFSDIFVRLLLSYRKHQWDLYHEIPKAMEDPTHPRLLPQTSSREVWKTEAAATLSKRRAGSAEPMWRGGRAQVHPLAGFLLDFSESSTPKTKGSRSISVQGFHLITPGPKPLRLKKEFGRPMLYSRFRENEAGHTPFRCRFTWNELDVSVQTE